MQTPPKGATLLSLKIPLQVTQPRVHLTTLSVLYLVYEEIKK